MTVDRKRLSAAPRTDHGNALRFTAHADGALCWTSAHGWMRWEGTRWRPSESEDAALQLGRRVAVGVVDEAAYLPTVPAPGAQKSPAELHLDWAEKSQDARRIGNMVKLGRGSVGVLASSDGWDSQAGLINTPEGMLMLVDGAVEKHKPSMRVVKVTRAAPMSAAEYAAAWEGSTWARFLDWAMCGDASLAEYLQTAVGASLCGDQSCQNVFFCYGGGGNGKGVFERALRFALGPYVHALPRRFLEQSRGPTPSSDEYNLANLQGARMAVGSEVSKGAQWDEEKIKSLSGGDAVSARHPYGRPFSFAPSWVLWVLGNDKPRVESTDNGIWRRLRLIPWLASTETTPPEEQIAGLEDLLAAEAPLIVRWAQLGAQAWLASRVMPACEAVDAETARYRQAEDTIGIALDEMCEFSATRGTADMFRTQASNMTQAMIAWHRARGLPTRAMDRQLGEYMRRRLIATCGDKPDVMVKGTRYWRGVRLVDELAGQQWH